MHRTQIEDETVAHQFPFQTFPRISHRILILDIQTSKISGHGVGIVISFRQYRLGPEIMIQVRNRLKQMLAFRDEQTEFSTDIDFSRFDELHDP